jgi:hypothetical protein
VTANGHGSFSASVTPQDLSVGNVTISAACGSKRLSAVVSVVSTSVASTPESGGAVFGIFVLLGAVLVRGQFGGSATRRRRKRRGSFDIFEA